MAIRASSGYATAKAGFAKGFSIFATAIVAFTNFKAVFVSAMVGWAIALLKKTEYFYPIVEVLWVIDWQDLPSPAEADEVFGYSVKAYQGGDVMFLETMPTFQQYWQDQGGLPVFQERVRAMLNLTESSDNG